MKLTLVFAILFLPLLAQDPPPARPPGGGGPRPDPKNLKILPKENLMPTMQAFNAALGVKCNHCHETPNFASDEKHTKEVARHMLTMVTEINAKFPDGKMHVTCFTCHRGEVTPQTRAAAAPPPPPAPPQ